MTSDPLRPDTPPVVHSAQRVLLPRRQLLLQTSLGLCALALPRFAWASASDPRALLDRIDDLYRAAHSHAVLEMEVVTRRYQRTLKIEGWTLGTDQALFRILSPKKEAGTATLRVGKDLWNYLPRVRRTMRIPSSMMGGAWMGSDFTNDDLVKESRMTRDYDFRMSFEGRRDGRKIAEITCTPKAKAAVVWGRLVCEIDMTAEPLPACTRYFDEKGRLARTLYFEDAGGLDGRRLPKTLRLVPENKPGQHTEIRYLKLDTKSPVPSSTFSLHSLKG